MQCFPQTLYLWRHIYANSFSARRRRLEREREVSPVTVVHKAALRLQMLLYQTLHARWNKNDIQHFLETVGFLQKYSHIKTPAPGFDFETCESCLFNKVKAFWKIYLWPSVLILWRSARNKSVSGKHWNVTKNNTVFNIYLYYTLFFKCLAYNFFTFLLYVFEINLLCIKRLHLFDQKYSRTVILWNINTILSVFYCDGKVFFFGMCFVQ